MEGNILREEDYYLGSRDGEFIEYSKEGIVISKGQYIDNEKNGLWKYTVGDYIAVVEPEDVSIVIYDALGRSVTTLYDGPLAGGRIHDFVWDSGGRASGAYLIRILGQSFEEVRSVTLLK